jgi:hypothetical protein
MAWFFINQCMSGTKSVYTPGFCGSQVSLETEQGTVVGSHEDAYQLKCASERYNMEFTITTPALLFPAISLLMISYTTRFLHLAHLARSLHAINPAAPELTVLEQIKNIRKRILLIRNMQATGISSTRFFEAEITWLTVERLADDDMIEHVYLQNPCSFCQPGFSRISASLGVGCPRDDYVPAQMHMPRARLQAERFHEDAPETR